MVIVVIPTDGSPPATVRRVGETKPPEGPIPTQAEIPPAIAVTDVEAPCTGPAVVDRPYVWRIRVTCAVDHGPVDNIGTGVESRTRWLRH